MWRNYAVLLAIASFSVSPALADLVDVTVSGGADFSGSVVARCEGLPNPSCPNPGQGFDQEFLLFAGTNNNQDNFSASDSVTADNRVTLSTSVQQITDVSANSISVDLQSLATVDAFGAEWGAGYNGGPPPLILNAYLLDFTLTTESGVFLTGLGECSGGNGCYLENGDGSINIPITSGNQSFTLGPGAYSLTLHNELDAVFGPDGYGCSPPVCNSMASSGLSLTADFTPIVPEPRWASFLLATLLVVAVYASGRRRRLT
jgi:hypothetical protein